MEPVLIRADSCGPTLIFVICQNLICLNFVLKPTKFTEQPRRLVIRIIDRNRFFTTAFRGLYTNLINRQFDKMFSQNFGFSS